MVAVLPATALLAAACGGDTLDGLGQPDAALGEDATVGDAAAGTDAERSGSDAAGDASDAMDAGRTGDEGGALDAGDATADADADAAIADADADADADAGTGLSLQSAGKFAVLAGSTITIAAAPPPTTIVGDVGVSPGTSIVTLPPGQPVGTAYAGGAIAAQAQTDLTGTYNALAGMPCPAANNRAGIDLGGKTLAPGVYCFPATSAGITGALVLDAQLDPDATWVLQIGTTLTTATNASVTVINGGSACNVYWQVGTSATLGTGTAFAGNVIAASSITMVTGSTLAGRALARTGGVSLQGNAITAAACQ